MGGAGPGLQGRSLVETGRGLGGVRLAQVVRGPWLGNGISLSPRLELQRVARGPA